MPRLTPEERKEAVGILRQLFELFKPMIQDWIERRRKKREAKRAAKRAKIEAEK